MNELTKLQIDALQEVGNIGAAHAAIALSQIVGHTIGVSVTRLEMLSLEEAPQAIGGKEKKVVVVYLRLLGDMQGGILLALSFKDALLFIDKIKGQVIGFAQVLTELEEFALKESGSILAVSYVAAISQFTKLSLLTSVPKVATGKAEAVLAEIFGELTKRAKIAFCIETAFIETSNDIKGYFLLVPEAEGVELMFKALGIGG